MEKFHIELTEDEKALVDQIDFDSVHDMSADMHEIYKANRPYVLALMSSLEERHGIPTRRWNYWVDPECRYIDEDRSPRLELPWDLDREDTYDDLRFLDYIYYFLFGANLPDELIEMFELELKANRINVKHITSSDYGPLRTKVARKVAYAASREFGFNINRDYRIPEEFYRLSLDLRLSDLGHTGARTVKQEVKRVLQYENKRNRK